MESSKKRIINSVCFLVIFILIQACSADNEHSSLSIKLESLKLKHAPDSRTSVFTYEIKDKTLIGRVDDRIAKTEIEELLAQYKGQVADSMTLLPLASLGKDTLAFVNVSVGNIRTRPSESAELATQALLGTPLRILEKKGSWFRVQTPDQYIGYLENSAISFLNWQGKKVIYSKPYGFAFSEPNINSMHVSDLTLGNLLLRKAEHNSFTEVLFPDGRLAFVQKKELLSLEAFLHEANSENLAVSSQELMGVPYLWGGTSWKGVDCSGFTRTVFLMNGIYLPRDASQQALIGDEIDYKDSFSHLEEGDLLFFGSSAAEGSKVKHVALYLGNQKFIHSSGMVRYGSFNEESPYFDAYNLGRFLFAKRILGSSNIKHLNTENFY